MSATPPGPSSCGFVDEVIAGSEQELGAHIIVRTAGEEIETRRVVDFLEGFDIAAHFEVRRR